MLLVAIGTLVPLLVYLVVGFSRSSRVANERDYFIGGGRVSVGDYANTSVGYALQMAALFLFASWGILYGVGALWTALFWAVGYWLLYLLLPFFKPYWEVDEPLTLHAFVRRRFGAGRSLQVLAAAATVVGLVGTMVAEVDYTALVYTPVTWARPIYVESFFLVLGLSYIVFNGFKAEVNTERIQVPIAYGGLLLTLLVILPSVWTHAGRVPFAVISGVIGLALGLVILGKMSLARASRVRDPQLPIILVALGVLIIECLWVPMSRAPGTGHSVLTNPLGTQLTAQGALGLVSLFFANALWMPVDISTWQRVASVEKSGNVTGRLRAGTARVLLESPATWCLGAVLGWSIQAGGFLPAEADPFTAIGEFSRVLGSGSAGLPLGADKWLYPIWIAACVAVMLSTVNSLLSAISYTVERDILGDTREDLARVRVVTAVLLLLGFVAYEVLRQAAGANLSTLLYGAYSAQLSLIVVVLIALGRRRRSARGAFGSLIVGLVASAAATWFAVGNPDPTLAVLPPIYAVVGGLVGYLIMNGGHARDGLSGQ